MSHVDMQKQINTLIETLQKSEKVTRKTLSVLSRDLLEYVVLNGTDDIDMVNRTLTVCSDANRDVATLYFKEFLPFTYSNDTGVFTTKINGEKRIDRYFAKCKDWLADKDNDVWVWKRDNVQIDKAPTPFSQRIEAIVKQAAEGTKKQDAITSEEIIVSVLRGGVQIAEVMDVLNKLAAQVEEQPAEMAKAA